MIITVKTNGKEIEALSGNCVKHTAKKSCFSVNSEDLQKVLAIIYSEGYTKAKISMESQDEKELIGEFNTKSPMEYLEHILAKEINNLEKDKDIPSFLKKIEFPCKSCNSIELIYADLIMHKEALNTTISRAYVFSNACYEGFEKGKNDLKKCIKEWLDEFHPDYIERLGRSVPYDTFLKFLLKHTGYKYY